MRQLFEIIGSPFSTSPRQARCDAELLAAYTVAYPNRVALLYLWLHRRPGWDPLLEKYYQDLWKRYENSLGVIADIARVLNEWNREHYVIFKSIKPYPASPNDTDLICLAGKAGFERMYQHVLSKGYEFRGWAPQQNTVSAPDGRGKIDLYSEISTDYFSYMDKKKLLPYIVEREINGVPVRLLRTEPETAIVMFHSIFPERTFQLEHFYLPLYALAARDFDLDLFLRYGRESGASFAIKTQMSIVARLHEKHFGFVPAPVASVLNALGRNKAEVRCFEGYNLQAPYLFSPKTFWTAFGLKLFEWHSLKSLFVQGFKMLNPHFFWDVVCSLRKRLSEKGAYHQD